MQAANDAVMPPAICDSEDENEDVYAVPDDDDDYKTPRCDLDGMDEGHSGSTERLQRQLASVERRLFASTSTEETQMAKDTNSSHKLKRRHTALEGSRTSATPSAEKRVKRSRSNQIPSSGDPQTTSSIDASLRNERSAGVVESVGAWPACWNDVEAETGGFGLGSLQSDFARHEPAVMFRDSGSTVPDGASEQERMLEQALANGTVGDGELDADHADAMATAPQESSVPWSASDEPVLSGGDPGVVPDKGFMAQMMSSTEQGPVSGGVRQAGDADEVTSRENEGDGQKDSAMQDTSQDSRLRGPSPRVEIPPVDWTEVGEVSRSDADCIDVAATTKEATQSLDDLAIDLPPEMYVPRPSRRRATHISPETAEWSPALERAIKKRRKTADATLESNPSITNRQDDKNETRGDDDIRIKSGNAPKAESPKPSATKAKKPRKTASEQADTSIDLTSHANNINSAAKYEPFPPKPSPSKPSPPTKKSRRSHTTIYEDHTEYTSTHSSPSLHEQQATRKAALKDVSNQRRRPPNRRSIKLSDDEDDDDNEVDQKPTPATAAAANTDSDTSDELSKPDPPAQPPAQAAPKKRRRGRPPKSALPVCEDSETEQRQPPIMTEIHPSDHDDEHEADHIPSPSPPRKKRGRPRKASRREPELVMPNDPESPAKHSPAPGEKDTRREAEEHSVPEEKEKESSITAPPLQPSPPLLPAAPAPAPAPKPSMPTLPTYRAGLSRRQRVQPLLKMVKGPRPPTR